MRAVICKEFAPYKNLTVEEVADPQAGPGQVVIDVKAAGVNFPDILLVEGKYQMKPPLPFTPGGEVSGTIAAVGDGVEGFKAGDRVVAATLLDGFAEKVVTAANQVAPIPDSMPFDEAAALITTYATTIHALKQRGDLKSGETLVVLGAGGGVGTAACQLGKAYGARVIGCARGKEKLEAARQAGADELVDYDSEDLKARLKELTGGKGADVVYHAAGGTGVGVLRRLFRAGHARAGLGRSLPGHRFRCWRHTENAAEPGPVEQPRYPGRVLGRLGRPVPTGKREKHGRTLRALRGRQDQAHGLGQLSARRCHQGLRRSDAASRQGQGGADGLAGLPTIAAG